MSGLGDATEPQLLVRYATNGVLCAILVGIICSTPLLGELKIKLAKAAAHRPRLRAIGCALEVPGILILLSSLQPGWRVEHTIPLFISDFEMNSPRHINKLSDLVLVGVFALTLLFPTLCSLCHSKKTGAIDEYRPLAAFPGLSMNAVNLEAFTRRFEEHYNDHFGGRELLIVSHLKIKYALFPLESGAQGLGRA